MKKLFTIFSLILTSFLLFTFCKQEVKKDVTIPITASSEVVKQLYDDAMKALQEFKFNDFQESINKALAEDSTFFIANYIMAMSNFKDSAKFAAFAGNAIACEAELSEGEQLLKNSLEQLAADKNADVTENGKKLVDLYPKDIVAYYQMLTYQTIAGDTSGQVTTLKKALENMDNIGPVYNNLGYVYMALGQMDSAAVAFDKYIELEPNHPNPYDSKGDYFMKIEDYKNALETYQKATEVDSTWQVSTKKMMKAKMMCDSLKIE